MYTNQTSGLAYNFNTPDTDAVARVVDRTPNFPVVEVMTVATSATPSYTPLHPKTLVLQAMATATPTLSVVTTYANAGDELIIKFTIDSTEREIAFGTGFLATGNLTGTASRVFVVRFIFDGTVFVEVSRTAAMTP